jgi:Endonuclease I
VKQILSLFFATLLLAASGSILVACSEELSKQGSDSLRKLNQSSQQARIANYDEARKIFWQGVYPQGGETLYCGRPFLPKARRNFNIEHVFPMSWVSNALDCGKRKQCRARSEEFNRIEADLHNLYPARTDVNRARDSFRFGQVQGESRDYGRDCDFETNWRARVAEPREAVRGEVARAMFYMADEYREQGLEIFKKQAKLLLEWHKADPPSKAEMKRNDRIEELQGNRNRFIDDPLALDQAFKQWY